MKHILIIFIAILFCLPMPGHASTSSIPFTHQKLFGTWKKHVGSKPEDPLYVSFIRNYGLPDERGTFFDSAKIAVLEPPKEHANYNSLLDFMTPKEFNGDKKQIRMENDPLTFSEIKLGGAKGRGIRGTGRLIYINGTYPVTNMLAKGYYFETERGVIEILVQIRSVKGDLGKIELDVDEMVNSFRFGLDGDIAMMELIKDYKPEKVIDPPKQAKAFPIVWIFYGLASLLVICFVLMMFRVIKKPLKKKG